MSTTLREYLPLQQGLRHTRIIKSGVGVRSQRVSSITTRIKTFSTYSNINLPAFSESIFHYNKD